MNNLERAGDWFGGIVVGGCIAFLLFFFGRVYSDPEPAYKIKEQAILLPNGERGLVLKRQCGNYSQCSYWVEHSCVVQPTEVADSYKIVCQYKSIGEFDLLPGGQ